ncbi:MAG: DUF4082 domain-containing protein [Phycisphaerales bacterium]
MKRSMFAVAAALGLVAGTTCAANELALDFSSVIIDTTNGSWSLGWEFTANADIVVTELGFYDDLMNDLVESHEVGIFDLAGNLLVSGTVNPGDPLNSWWRFTDVPDTALSAGDSYVIAAVTLTENYTWNPIGFVTAPEISFVVDRWVSSFRLDFPTESDGGGLIGWFGPNFNFVPGPGGIALLLLGGLIGTRRRRCRARTGRSRPDR